ncbi:MAG: hypothetical protein PHV11_07150 [Candidatus Bipolaricaulis sp.]|nr:hypothetical protein [Candidatus Bipolaricaulis sp.]MDD5220325.1 hypothetical protein [Candidatus Bipolaricaulis sp.]
MSAQGYILLAVGLFMGLIVTGAGIQQYLLDAHPTTKVEGLIWRVERALAGVRDLEAVVEFTEEDTPDEPMRMFVQLVSGPPPAVSARYLAPAALRDEVYAVQNDLLSHYLPRENLLVVKRWVGLPIAAIGLSGLDVSQIKAEWIAGRLQIGIVKGGGGFPLDGFPATLAVGGTFVAAQPAEPYSFAFDPPIRTDSGPSFSTVETTLGEVFQTAYVLEVRSAETRQLERMVWIDRRSFLVQKVVFYVNGARERTVRVERITLNQGLSSEQILTLPEDAEVVRG